MKGIDTLFFELIRVAIGTSDDLSRKPDADEWSNLYKMAQKQSLVGICFAGVQRLCDSEREDYYGMSELQYLTWMGMATKIQQRNEVVNKQCVELQRMLTADGFQSCVLKGQAVASLYGSLAGLRQWGDIDTWMVAEPEVVIDWARSTGTMYYYDYHHADLSLFKDTEIELHYRASLSRNLLRNERLQRWLKGEGSTHIVYKENLGFSVPDYTFNVVLTLNHNFWHLLYEGVGMRQIMDLYFVLKSCSNHEQKDEALKLLKHLKLLRFTGASMWIMKEVFGLEEKYLLCNPEEDAGRFLLDEIMQAGNFGHYDERLKEGRYKASRLGLMWTWMKHNLRLIKYYPADVFWTPIGILRISLWRRWHYRNEKELNKI